MSEARWPLSPRAARVFYGVADAWIPAADGRPGGADLDLVAALAPDLGDTRERRRLERTLWMLEWSPRLLLRSRRGLCWMEQRTRRAWLERLEQSRVQGIARSVARVRALVAASHARVVASARQSLPGA